MKNLMWKMVVLLGMCAPGLVAWGGDCPCDELRINEICYAPAEGGSQWVEIVNTGDEVVFPNGAELVGDTGALTLPGELGGIPARGIILVVFDGADASENRYECAPGAAVVLHGPAEGMFGNPVGFCGLYRVTDVHTPETLLDFLAWGGEPGEASADAVAKGVWNSTSSYLVTGAGGEIGPYVAMQEGGSFARSSETYVGWNVLGPGDVTLGLDNYSLAAPVLHYPPVDSWYEEEPSYFSWFPVMNASSYVFQLADSEDFTNLRAEGNGLTDCRFENDGGMGLREGVYYWRVRALVGEEAGPWSGARRLEKGYYFLTGSDEDAEPLADAMDISEGTRKASAKDKDRDPSMAYVSLRVKFHLGSELRNVSVTSLKHNIVFPDGTPYRFTDKQNWVWFVPPGNWTITVDDEWKKAIASISDGVHTGETLPLTLVAGQDYDITIVLNPKEKILPNFKKSFGAKKDSALLATGQEGGMMCTRFDNVGDQGWDCPHTDFAGKQESWYCWAAALKALCFYYGDVGDEAWTRDAIIYDTHGKLGFGHENSGVAGAEGGRYQTRDGKWHDAGGPHVFRDESAVMQFDHGADSMLGDYWPIPLEQCQSIIVKSLEAGHPLIASYKHTGGGHAEVVYGYQWSLQFNGAVYSPALQVYAANVDNKSHSVLKYLSSCNYITLYHAKQTPEIIPMPARYREDKDGDGVLDADEERFGTEKNKADTDGDGIPDKEEIASQEFPRKLNGEYDARVQLGGNIGDARLPARTKDPAKEKDTDEGGVDDGAEDLNQDGMWDKDAGETDIFDKADDNQLDVVFCFDTTGSMSSMLSSVKGKATDLVNKYLKSETKSPVRFAVVEFRDKKEDGKPPTTVLGFSSDGDAVIRAVNSLYADGGGDWREDVNDALMHCINLSGWRGGGVKRRILLMGDAPDNGRGTRWTTVLEACQRTETEVTRRGVRRKVARESFGPISIITFPVGGNSETLANFKEIAEATDGVCIPVGSASDTGDAIMAALEAIETTPLVELAVEGEWGAKHIVADATGTTDPRGCGIVKYEWDWEADGTYDEWSYKAVAEKDYPAGFQGKVRVRATSATGDKGTRTVIIVAPEFLDVTTMTDMALASARLDPNTGAIVCDITLGNKTDTVKTLKDKFWFVLPSTSTIFLASPDGTMEDGTPYVDITAAVEAALPSVGNGDLCLDPGETVVLKDAIAIYSYDRSVPTGFMFAVWADPPPDAAGSGSSVGGKVKKSIVGYKLDRKAEEASLTLEDGEEMRHGFMYSTNLVDWSQTPVPLTNPAVFIRVGSPE